jgi:BASS family bile acid:Na+ symporter
LKLIKGQEMEVGQVYYDANSQWLLNLVLASMILGIALDIKWRDFKAVAKMPKAIISGLIAQFLFLPAVTTGLTLILDLPAGIELGMILVSACPGGAISNFVTHLSGGNTALSISMTAASSALAVVFLPINFIFWSQLNPTTALMLQTIDVDSTALFINLLLVLALPLSLGLLISSKWPNLAKKVHKVFNVTSLLALVAFIGVAIGKNQDAFLSHFNLIFIVVLLHNAVAYFLGFLSGKFAGISQRDIKATTIEVGMQNSSLAIAIVFTQFNGEADMALISAFWGTWHIISGLLIALTFRRIFSRSTITA